MNLTKLGLFNIPGEVVDETEKHLRHAGRRGLELFVLWSGVVSGTEFIARTVHVPLQTSYQLDSGLMVRVEGDALHQLNAWLYSHEEVLAVQIHAHPTEAFHSATDDTFPIVTGDGSISIVVANFCREGLFSYSTAVYRLNNQSWLELDPPFGMFQVNQCP